LGTSPSPRQPFRPGGGRAALWQRRAPNTTQTRVYWAKGALRRVWRRGAGRAGTAAPASSGRQHHDHPAAPQAWLLLDLGELGRVVLDAIEELIAQLLVRHLAAAEAQRDLDLVTFLEEALHRAHLHVVIVVVDHRPELDLLDLDHLLFLAGFRRLLLRLVFVFAVIENFADGRGCIAGNLYEFEHC